MATKKKPENITYSINKIDDDELSESKVVNSSAEITEEKAKKEIKTEKCKVLLSKYDGVVIDFDGSGIFIETKEKYKVGTYIEVKVDGKNILL